jgi:hypothetical protein
MKARNVVAPDTVSCTKNTATFASRIRFTQGVMQENYPRVKVRKTANLSAFRQ